MNKRVLCLLGSTLALSFVWSQPVAADAQQTVIIIEAMRQASRQVIDDPVREPVALSGLTLVTSSALTGATVQGNVTLTANAPAGGTSVMLSSSNVQTASVSATQIQIPAGRSQAPFTVNAQSMPGTVIITARLGSATRTVQLTVQLPAGEGRDTAGGSSGTNGGEGAVSFVPVVIAAQGMGMTGNRQEPVAFEPIIVNAQGMSMTGKRQEPVAFEPIIIDAQNMGMTGIR